MISEKVINFKVDAELYTKVKIKVALDDATIKDYIISLIMKDLENDVRISKDHG